MAGDEEMGSDEEGARGREVSFFYAFWFYLNLSSCHHVYICDEQIGACNLLL